MMRAGLALVAALLAMPASADDHVSRVNVVEAILVQWTDRYGPDVLGDAAAARSLKITYKQCADCRGLDLREVIVTLPETRVFEKVEPLIVDADGDGLREILVVETDLARGPSLAVYGPGGKRAATPFSGRLDDRLTPVGVGDFDGDGRPEIAFVNRTYLQRDLFFLRLTGDRLTGIARLEGMPSHRSGNWAIGSVVRTCGGLTEVILPDAAWRRLIAARLRGGQVITRDAGPLRGAASLDSAAAC